MLKTHMCGNLDSSSINKDVTLAGWVSRRRDHGGLTFIDLRDSSGIIQIVLRNEELNIRADNISIIRNEWVIIVHGTIMIRQKGTENKKMKTGLIELIAKEITISNKSNTPPFPINEDIDIDELNRMKYRYLDLRRSKMLNNLKLRHNVTHFIRNFLSSKEFIEIETPILNVATPEGARDYLVPSRVHPGKFYALPQSPQQWKQLLMVGGFEKYFQIARCFRDEDLRSDRQPEFTQLDIEMSFVEQEDILMLIEELFTKMIDKLTPRFSIPKKFPSITYNECIEKYGTDKPDLRFGIEIHDLKKIFLNTEIIIFKKMIDDKKRIRAINIPNGSTLSKKQIKKYNEIAIKYGSKGVASISLDHQIDINNPSMDQVDSLLKQFLSQNELENLIQEMKSEAGDLILISADEVSVTSNILSEIRVLSAELMNLIDYDKLSFCFVTEFPMFEFNKLEDRWTAMHHLFTMPFEEDIHLIDNDPGQVRSHAYDIVCNGQEVGSGSIRIHQADLFLKVLKRLDIDEKIAYEQFEHMIQAFSYGAPPHGGIAPGIDRLVAILAKESDIREVIAFPKTKTAADILTGAPSFVDQKYLDELQLSINEDERQS
jgi:aspartyl-tRNA synthetase